MHEYAYEHCSSAIAVEKLLLGFSVGMDIMDMMNDMPLVSVLMFQQDALPAHPEDMVADLLKQVHAM